MAADRESMSPMKIGLGVLWPACWTGLPLKLAFAVLVLAMGLMQFGDGLGLPFLMLFASPVTIFALPIITLGLAGHLGEGVGFPLLFLISIPIDIWALGVVGRTLLLEKFRKEPPEGLGLTLWWKLALIGAFFLPILWLIVSTVTSTAISMAHALMETELFKGIPIPERISIEVTLWGSVALTVLIVLLLIGVSLAGWMIRRVAEAAQPASENYQGLITRWDLMRVPTDQGLMLTALTGAGVVLSLLFWAALPVTTPDPHECCENPEMKAQPLFKPLDALNENEQRIAQLSAQLEALEQQKAEAEAGKGKGKGTAQGGKAAPPAAVQKP